MTGQRPTFRIYVSKDDEGKIDFKADEFCALWQNESKAGKRYYSGKLKDGRKVVMFETEQRSDGEPDW